MSTIGSCTGMPYSICRPVDWAGIPLGMRATSKLVPPMSQEITSSMPASAASSAAPTVPAAGPERTVRTGCRDARSICMSPPLDCMTHTSLLKSSSVRRRRTSRRYSAMRGCTKALTAVVDARSNSGGGDECRLRTLALEDGIGGHRCAVHDSRKLPHHLHDLVEPPQETIGLVASREHFRRPSRTGFGVVHDDVGKSTADVDTSDEAHRVCLS